MKMLLMLMVTQMLLIFDFEVDVDTVGDDLDGGRDGADADKCLA